jgi:hypothetical protein
MAEAELSVALSRSDAVFLADEVAGDAGSGAQGGAQGAAGEATQGGAEGDRAAARSCRATASPVRVRAPRMGHGKLGLVAVRGRRRPGRGARRGSACASALPRLPGMCP